jgi:deoxyribose-phosphate aldolase
MNLAGCIDHTFLKQDTTTADVKKICQDAIEYGFAAVCIPPPLVQHSKAATRESAVKVATVIGFPFGYSVARAKLHEAQQAMDDGADELDVVINLVALKSKAWKYLESEIKFIIDAAHKKSRLVKVIIESGILNEEEIVQCCELYSGAGADFLKTSTGYAAAGATIEAVALMRSHLPENVQIKASGGIRTYEFALKLIEAGATRLGCSASVEIIKGGQSAGVGY